MTTTLSLDRTATNPTTGHRYSAYGPVANGLFTVWDHEMDDQDRGHVGWFEDFRDAVDLMMELAYS